MQKLYENFHIFLHFLLSKGNTVRYSFISDHRDWSWHQDKGSAVGQPIILVPLEYSIFMQIPRNINALKLLQWAMQRKNSTNILHDMMLTQKCENLYDKIISNFHSHNKLSCYQ